MKQDLVFSGKTALLRPASSEWADIGGGEGTRIPTSPKNHSFSEKAGWGNAAASQAIVKVCLRVLTEVSPAVLKNILPGRGYREKLQSRVLPGI
ncbi:hypothetical protein [Leptolyngbya iicbica]|uniref:Uncharacterized protein n=2 Tax=Cyanophyceae TaxID=3028117 RepID=A0A4Q7E2P1_9CYAN|nr:hypothetical protein [Leptolyngbya sp. LK]RZM75946.1 hypothetical protein DYY88_18775 [Leptolyngbya sp. LK]